MKPEHKLLKARVDEILTRIAGAAMIASQRARIDIKNPGYVSDDAFFEALEEADNARFLKALEATANAAEAAAAKHAGFKTWAAYVAAVVKNH